MNIVLFLGVLCVTVTLSSASVHKERIINGLETDIKNYPFQVSLQTPSTDGKYNHFCGGSIINESWILTAAHCTGTTGQNVYVLAGSTKKSETQVGQFIKVLKTIVHEDYFKIGDPPRDMLINDIALMQLEKPLIFKENVQPIDLPKLSSTPNGTAYLTGWGLYNETGPLIYPENLLFSETTIIDNQDCRSRFQKNNMTVMMNTNICTFTPSRAGCNGDSGGPLSQNGTVIGIASFTYDPCTSEPLVYTKVSAFLDFIDKVMLENSPK